MTSNVVTARCPRHPCQDFAASMPATRGLIAAPWTPASLSLLPGKTKPDSLAGTKRTAFVRFLFTRPARCLGWPNLHHLGRPPMKGTPVPKDCIAPSGSITYHP